VKRENILDMAMQIVAERDACYDSLIADMYTMALLAEDCNMVQQLWQEAWEEGTAHLVALLVEVDMQHLEARANGY